MRRLFEVTLLFRTMVISAAVFGIAAFSPFVGVGTALSFEINEDYSEPPSDMPPYSRLGFDGEELPEDASHVSEGGPWIMTRDNTSGLIWEAKTNDPGLQYNSNTYSWFDPDPDSNGGHAGAEDGGSCTGSSCDSNGFIQALNKQGFGGYSDWRIPSVRELKTLLNQSGDQEVSIDRYWFRRASSSAYYWSSTSFEGNNYAAWRVGTEGLVSGDFKSHSYHVMAVRRGNLAVLSPEKDSVWPVGEPMEISWETMDIPGNVRISISRHEGLPGSFDVVADGLKNDGSYVWNVTGPGSPRCVVRIEPLEEPARTTKMGPFVVPFTLNYRAGMNGTLRGELSQAVEDGKHGTVVEAVPDEGYRFLEWTDGSRDNPRRDMYVKGNLSVNAVFVSDPS